MHELQQAPTVGLLRSEVGGWDPCGNPLTRASGKECRLELSFSCFSRVSKTHRCADLTLTCSELQMV